MKGICSSVLFLLITHITVAQKGFQIEEVKGEIISILPGSEFAYSILSVLNGTDTAYYRFPPEYGELILAHLKPGMPVDMKVKVRSLAPGVASKLKKQIYFLQNEILEITIENQWKTLETGPFQRPEINWRVFIEKKVTGDYFVNNLRMAFLFDEGCVALSTFNSTKYNHLKEAKPGNYLSFVGYEIQRKPGYVYPISSVKRTFSFSKLDKKEGEVKAFLYKQNFVCLGLVIQTKYGDASFSFPTEWASRIKQFTKDHPSLTVYFFDFKIDKLKSPPELHALIDGSDTLKIEKFGFFGGEDANHDHRPASVEGKISAINKSDKGKILSAIIGNDCYIEVDENVEKQLSPYLKRGTVLKVEGEERIKKEGEIYSRDYRIISPQKITVDEKIFLLNPLP